LYKQKRRKAQTIRTCEDKQLWKKKIWTVEEKTAKRPLCPVITQYPAQQKNKHEEEDLQVSFPAVNLIPH
jgi:carbamoylphosphate synthase large subunit